MNNPFAPRDIIKIPSMLYGYREDLSDIISGVTALDSQRRSFRINGGPSMGKTSLILALDRQIYEFSSECDTQVIFPLRMDLNIQQAKDFFVIAATEIHAAINRGELDRRQFFFPHNKISDRIKSLFIHVSSGNTNRFENFLKALDGLTTAVQPAQLRLVFLIDDVWKNMRRMEGKDTAIRSLQNDLYRLHENVDGLQNVVAYVIASSIHDWGRNGSANSLYEKLIPKNLHVFQRSDVHSFITNHLHISDDSVFEKIYSESGGHPYLLQCLLSEIWENQRDQQFVTAQQVVEAMKKIQQENDDFDRWWDKLYPDDKYVYKLLSEEPSNTFSPSDLSRNGPRSLGAVKISEALRVLNTAGLLREVEDRRYAIAGRWPMKLFLETLA